MMLKNMYKRLRSSRAYRRFKRNKLAIVGAGIIFIFLIMAIFAPIIAPRHPQTLNPNSSLKPPCAEFPFGTDNIGRDIFSWVIWGARVSFIVGVGAVLIELIIGISVGMIAGYFGGWFDHFLMRITDVMLCLPSIILIIVASAMFATRSIYLITVIMGVLGWPWMARVVRAQFLSLKELSNVEAAKSIGVSDFRIILRHILPSALPSVIVLATLDIPWYILYEAALSFLGLGDPTSVSWGMMVNIGKQFLRVAPWVTTFPGLATFLLALGFNLFGDGLRDALDVRLR